MKRNSGGYNPNEEAPTVWAYLQDARWYGMEWSRMSVVRDDLHEDRLMTFWSGVAKIWEMRHQWPKTEPNGDNPWLAPTVHADHGTRRRSHQTSDVICLRETPVVSIVLRNVWFLSFCLAFLSECNKWWMRWSGWHTDLNNFIVNTTYTSNMHACVFSFMCILYCYHLLVNKKFHNKR